MIDAIDRALDRLPPDLLARSGSVFYTGKEAFRGERPVYFLGLGVFVIRRYSVPVIIATDAWGSFARWVFRLFA